MDGSCLIGLLSLQGAALKHRDMLSLLGVESIEVKNSNDLNKCQGLIIPGGESTVMVKQMQEADLFEPLKTFGANFPCFGTCAGMIVLALMGFLDIKVLRNGYGRQIDSFSTELTLNLSPPSTMEGVFIRAPRIQMLCSSEIQILASFQEEPVCIQQGHHLACAFHPELTDNLTLHSYFVTLCKKNLLPQLL